jgi:hypothetical protein
MLFSRTWARRETQPAGNPFVAGKHGTREECVRMQEAYIINCPHQMAKANVNCAKKAWLASVSLLNLVTLIFS